MFVGEFLGKALRCRLLWNARSRFDAFPRAPFRVQIPKQTIRIAGEQVGESR